MIDAGPHGMGQGLVYAQVIGLFVGLIHLLAVLAPKIKLTKTLAER